MKPSRVNSRPALWVLSSLPLIACSIFVIHSLWFSNSHLRGADGHIFYVAGKVWLAGESPYDRDSMLKHFNQSAAENQTNNYASQGLFISPPTLAPLSIFLGSFRWSTSLYLLELLNIFGFALIAYFCASIIRNFKDSPISPFSLFCVGFSGFIGAIEATLILGQLAILALAGGFGVIYAWRKKRVWMGVLFILVASWKPQISFLLLLYIFFTGWITPFIIAGVIATLILISAEYNAGIGELISRFIGALEAYQENPYNSDISNKINITAVFGNRSITSILFVVGFAAATLITLLMGVSHFRAMRNTETVNGHEFKQNWKYHILFCLLLTGAFVPLNSYDLVVVAACVMLTPLCLNWLDRAAILITGFACIAPHGVEHKLITAATPIVGHLNGSVMQLLGGGSCIALLCLLAIRAPWKNSLLNMPSNTNIGVNKV